VVQWRHAPRLSLHLRVADIAPDAAKTANVDLTIDR